MEMLDQYYIPYLEWEYSNFPITLIQLTFEKTNWGFSSTAVISVWRDDDYRLNGKISGNVNNPQKLEEEHFVGKGNIIKGQIITGKNEAGCIVEIQECFLTHFQTTSWEISPAGYYMEGHLTMNSIKIHFPSQKERRDPLTRFDWFICAKIGAHFSGSTFRKQSKRKVRIGIDEYDDSIANLQGSSTSKDYVLVKIPELNFVIAKVPDKFSPNHLNGLCLEFQNNLEKVNDDLLNGIRNFISFLTGNEINYIGYSYADGVFLKEAFLVSLDKKNLTSPMPPIKFNLKYEWGDISWLLNQFLPKYLELRKILPIDQALSRYWVARSIPIGSNLPVLASALEMIAEKYLKTTGNYRMVYLPEADYLQLIEAERKELEAKLSSLEGGDIIMNKIAGAFRKGPNEKMSFFFFSADIMIGQLEKKAIALRNKMVHSSRDYSKEESAHEDLVYTRVYEVLFQRTILKLLGYDGYYIDYSIQGCPIKHIDRNAGKD